jgi:hypothetical protein
MFVGEARSGDDYSGRLQPYPQTLEKTGNAFPKTNTLAYYENL